MAAGAPSDDPLQEILVPVDFSTASDSALNYAQALAETFHARLHVLHVLEDWVLYGGLDPAPPEVRVDLERSARENLAKMLPTEVVRPRARRNGAEGRQPVRRDRALRQGAEHRPGGAWARTATARLPTC